MRYPPEQPLSRPIRLSVLISGGGTTLDNLMQKIHAGTLNAEVVQVIASRADCGGIAKAKAYGIPTSVISRKDYSDTSSFSAAAFDEIANSEADLVILGGFLSLLQIPEEYVHRVMNIHPSLIPAFCGKGFHGSKVHEAVFARGVRLTGCTVHFADNQYDHGPIIVQRSTQLVSTDTPEKIAAKVFTEECAAYPEAIQLYAEGRLRIEDRRVIIQETL